MSDNIFETLAHTFREHLGDAQLDAAVTDANS